MSLGPADHVLLFLASHPPAHLKQEIADKLDHPLLKLVGANHGVLDQNATISIDNNHVVTVKTTGPASPQTFTSSSFAAWSNPPAPLPETKGRLFARGVLPEPGPSTFWVQEFPPYPSSSESGRVTVEFWNSERILAVFKTDSDNEKGAQGDGLWA